MTRLERLEALLEHYCAGVEDYDEGEEEDLRPYFDAEAEWAEEERSREPSQWCCITLHHYDDPKYFFLPVYDTAISAMDRAERFAEDDLFHELPVAVVDLDTGKVFQPRLSVSWEQTNGLP